MTEHDRRRHDAAFGFVLLLLCVLPLAGYWLWHRYQVVPAICAPVIYQLDPDTTLELQAVSIAQYGSDEFWSPNGVAIPQADLKHTSGGPDLRMRAVYFRSVRKNGTQEDSHRIHINPSPVLPGVGIGGSSAYEKDPESGDYVATYCKSFAPDVGMFHATELEVLYSSIGFFDVAVLEAGETKKEFSIAGNNIIALIKPGRRKGDLRVELTGVPTDTEMDTSLIDAAGDSVRPTQYGTEYDGVHNVQYAEFSVTNYSQVNILAQHWDRKVVFSGISYDSGSYTHPKVTEVAP